MNTQTEVVKADGAVSETRSAAEIVRHVKLIEEVSSAVMKDGVHYGKIPGCGDKPTLLKPGAEKLLLTFRLSTRQRVEVHEEGPHREYRVVTEVLGQAGNLVAEGVGTCSTKESKYRWRQGSRKCPKCGKEGSIIKGKAEYGGGWLCWKKKDGCDAKFKDGDESIEKQVVDRIENPDIADVYNTVLKMAKKRSMVDAALTATAASDFFAQDLEELRTVDAELAKTAAEEESSRGTLRNMVDAASKPPPVKSDAEKLSEALMAIDAAKDLTTLGRVYAEVTVGRAPKFIEACKSKAGARKVEIQAGFDAPLPSEMQHDG